MTPDLQSAQLSHDFRLPPSYFERDDGTEQERLQWMADQGAKAVNRLLPDGIEAVVEPHCDGTFALRLVLLGVTWDTRAAVSDVLVKFCASWLKEGAKR